MSLTKIQITEIAENIDAGLHCYVDLDNWSMESIPDPNRHNRERQSSFIDSARCSKNAATTNHESLYSYCG